VLWLCWLRGLLKSQAAPQHATAAWSRACACLHICIPAAGLTATPSGQRQSQHPPPGWPLPCIWACATQHIGSLNTRFKPEVPEWLIAFAAESLVLV
jgi:hypothetical protein